MSAVTVTVIAEPGETGYQVLERAWAQLTERMSRREREKYAALRPSFSDELSEFDPEFDSGQEAY
jgi:hypothetical protein